MSLIKESSKKISQFFSVRIKSIFPSFFQEENVSPSDSIVFKDHIDPTKTREEKIEKEKRRRNQAYLALDYFLSMTTYFDFFSFDSFQIARDAKIFTQITNKKIVTSDLLLLPFFYTNSPVVDILEKYGITKDKIEEIVADYHIKPPVDFLEKNVLLFKQFLKDLMIYNPNHFKEIRPNPKIKYSLEINTIFEKAAENALLRFKTPVISTEILFITLMEEENSRVGKIIRKFFTDETQWLLLRYNLMKKLHQRESLLRNEISFNQSYFAYLLTTKFSDLEFDTLVKNGYLSEAVIAFRNELIANVLRHNIYEELEYEICSSFELNKKRGFREYSLE